MHFFFFFLGLLAGAISRKGLVWCWTFALVLREDARRQPRPKLRSARVSTRAKRDLFSEGSQQAWRRASYSSARFGVEGLAGAGVSPDSSAERSKVMQDDVRDWLKRA